MFGLGSFIFGYLFGWDQYGSWQSDPYYQDAFDDLDDFDFLDWL